MAVGSGLRKCRDVAGEKVSAGSSGKYRSLEEERQSTWETGGCSQYEVESQGLEKILEKAVTEEPKTE